MLDTTLYRITVCDPIYNESKDRYALFIRKDGKLITVKDFYRYSELKLYLDICNIDKSLFKVTIKTKPPFKPFCRYILESKIENDNIRNNSK